MKNKMDIIVMESLMSSWRYVLEMKNKIRLAHQACILPALRQFREFGLTTLATIINLPF